MNVLGIIAEFNPVHKGHHYLLQKARTQCAADYTIVVMSGSFTQRGEPAIYDKFTRTRLALSCGADLVLEIPAIAATASARDFARTGVALLAATGVVTHLAFGCENVNPALLNKISGFLSKETDNYKTELRQALKEGASWPSARSQALLKLMPNESDDLSAFLKQPNNILAMEYLMALHSLNLPGISRIIPVPVQRIHSGYHDQSLDTPICSATALRSAILNGKHTQDYILQFPPDIREDILHILDTQLPMQADDFSQAMIFKLLSLSPEELTDYLDVDHYLSRRIYKQLGSFTGFTAFCDELCTRAYTRTRISRALLHTLLDIKKTDQKALIQTNYAPYLRVLGFRSKASPLFGYIKKNALAPIVTRPAQVLRCPQTQLIPRTTSKNIQDPPVSQACETALAKSFDASARLFSLDIHASDIYRSMYSVKSHQAKVHELQQKIIII